MGEIPEKLFVLVLLAIVIAFGWGALELGKEAIRKKEEFMTDCQKDHKKYECTAMWRKGSQSVVPVYIPMPTGR